MQQSYAENRDRGLSKHAERDRIYSARLAGGNAGYQKISPGMSALESNPLGVLNCCQQANARFEAMICSMSALA